MRPRNPNPGWVAGYGELARQHRYYTTLHLGDFSKLVGISEASLRDIERGRRDLPEEIMERIEELTEKFDEEVDATIVAAEGMITGDESVHLPVTSGPEDAWQRAVIGRAAVLSGKIVPILDGKVPVG